MMTFKLFLNFRRLFSARVRHWTGNRIGGKTQWIFDQVFVCWPQVAGFGHNKAKASATELCWRETTETEHGPSSKCKRRVSRRLFRLEQRLKHFADILIALHAFKLYIVIVMSHEFNYILAQSIDVIGIWLFRSYHWIWHIINWVKFVSRYSTDKIIRQ